MTINKALQDLCLDSETCVPSGSERGSGEGEGGGPQGTGCMRPEAPAPGTLGPG